MGATRGDDNPMGPTGGSWQGVILSYHRIAPPELDPWGLRVAPHCFVQHLAAVREVGEPVSLLDLVDRDRCFDPSRPAIALTFDDGYVDNFVEALPLLRAYAIPASVFIPTGSIGQQYFWWEAVESVFLRPNRLPPKLTLDRGAQALSWTLGTAESYTGEQHAADRDFCKWRGEAGSRVRLYHDVYDALWRMAYADRIASVRDILAWADLGPSALADARPMTVEEVRAIASDELISIGGHSVNHLPLDELPLCDQEAEIVGCRESLQDILGGQVACFAYPHGKYTTETLRVMRQAGYVAACTTREASLSGATEPLALPRVTVKNWSGPQFKEQLTKWLNA